MRRLLYLLPLRPGEWLQGYGPAIRYFLAGDIFFGLAQGLVTLVLNLHLLDLGLTADHIGHHQALGGLVMATLAIPAGMAADRWGRRGMYLAGSYGFALPLLVLPWVTAYPGLIALYAVYYLAFTLMFTTEFPLLAEEVPPEARTRLFSLVFVNFFLWQSLGTLAGGVLPRWLPPGRTAYHGVIVLAGVLGLGAGLLRTRMPLTGRYRHAGAGGGAAEPDGGAESPAGGTGRPDGSPGAGHAGSPVGGRLGIRLAAWAPLLTMGLLSALFGAGEALLANFGNVILRERFGLPDPAIGRLLTLAGVAGAAGNLLVPRLSDRLGQVPALVTAVLLMVPSLLLCGYSPSLVLFLTGFYARSILQFMSRPLTSALAMSAVPAHRRSAMSSFQMVGFNGGAALAARAYGALLARGDYRTPFLLAAAVVALGALVLVA
ncbi:MAG: MFS transporter, partial [Firmicutes bacterium]|nr:MFS transporter [Bacillota bacterium]